MAKPIQYCKVKKRKKICVEVRVESKSLGRISSVLPALSAWGHSLLEPVAREDLGLALAGSQRHPWLTQPLFTSHGMQSCWGRGRDSQICVQPTGPVVHSLLRDSPLPAAVGHIVRVCVCVCVCVCVWQATLRASTHHSCSLSNSKSLLNLNGK